MATIASMIYNIEAQTSSIEKSLKDVDSLLDNLGSRMLSTITGGVALGDALEHAGEKILDTAVTAVKDLASELVDLTLQGSAVNDVEQGFERLTEQAGHLGSELLGTLKAGTHGTIDDLDLMKQVNQDLAAGMNITDAQFGTLAQGARALANVTGGDVSSALETMNNAMLTGRARSVALLTGKIDLKAAEEAYAQAAGHTFDELTAEGKIEADRQAILHAVESALGRVGDQQDSLADKIQQSKVQWDDFQEQLGKSIATSPVVIQAFDGVKQILAEAFGGSQQQAIQKVTQTVVTMTIAAVDLGSTLVQVGTGIGEGWNAIEIVFDRTYNGLLHIESGLLKVNLAAVQAKAFVEPWNDFSTSVADLKAHIADVQTTITENQQAVHQHEQAEAQWAVTGQTLADKFQGLRTQLEATRSSTIAFVGPVQESTTAVTGAGAAASATSGLYKDSAAATKAYGLAWAELASIGTDFHDTFHTINQDLEAQIEYYLRAGASVQTLAAAYPELTKTQIQSVDLVVKETDKLVTQTAQVWDEYFKVTKQASAQTTQSQVEDIERWYQEKITAANLAKIVDQNYLDALESLHQAKLSAVNVDFQAVQQNSRDALQLTADKAAATYQYMLDHADQFSAGTILKFQATAVAAEIAAANWGTGWDASYMKANADMTKLATDAVTSFAVVGHGGDEVAASFKATTTAVDVATASVLKFVAVVNAARGSAVTAESILQGFQTEQLQYFGTGATLTPNLMTLPQIPHFPTGGPVTQTGPAIVHEGEFVVPRGGALVGSSGGPITVHLTLNGVMAADRTALQTEVDRAVTESLRQVRRMRAA